MKKLFFIPIMVLFLAACGGTPSQNSNTHTHEDGTMHSDDHEHEGTPSNQESFVVEEGDTISDHEHDHEHDHDHEHNH